MSRKSTTPKPVTLYQTSYSTGATLAQLSALALVPAAAGALAVQRGDLVRLDCGEQTGRWVGLQRAAGQLVTAWVAWEPAQFDAACATFDGRAAAAR